MTIISGISLENILILNGIQLPGGVNPIAIDTTLNLSTNMTGSITVTNPNSFSVGVVVTSGSSNVSIPSADQSIVVPATGSVDVTVLRETFSPIGSATVTISDGTPQNCTVSTAAAGTFTTLAANLGATHIYDFEVGDVYTDKAGSLDITVTNGSVFSVGAASITGAVGSYVHTATSQAAGSRVNNADWHRDSTPRTTVWIGQINGTTNTRAMYTGPGGGASDNDSFFSFAALNGYLEVKGPNASSTGGWTSNGRGVIADFTGETVLFTIWEPDPYDVSLGYVKVILVTNGGSTFIREIGEAAVGTTAADVFYLGGNGSAFYTQTCRWDHFSVYEKALSDDEINQFLRLRGYGELP
jgi:hypothetical protein